MHAFTTGPAAFCAHIHVHTTAKTKTVLCTDYLIGLDSFFIGETFLDLVEGPILNWLGGLKFSD